MKSEIVKDFYQQSNVVDHYGVAAGNIGLWESEKKILFDTYNPKETLLDLGCGAGRIAFGLYQAGYEDVTAIDFSSKMIKKAKEIARFFNHRVDLMVGDALNLDFEDETFDGVIFGFNGLMQIPGRENRRKAIREVYRVLKPGKCFVFTTHDRELNKYKVFWKEEKKRWNKGQQDKDLMEFGDRFEEVDLGDLFIHVPVPSEIREDLKQAEFSVEMDSLRSNIAAEPSFVRLFSDECRFWVAKKKT